MSFIGKGVGFEEYKTIVGFDAWAKHRERAPAGLMDQTKSEIDAVRALLRSRPRPVGWVERRERLDAIGSASPFARDIELEPIDANGVPAEWSLAPGSDPSRVLLFFHGGGYCSGSIASHRGMVTEAGRAAGVRTLAVGYRLAPEHPFPAALDDAARPMTSCSRKGSPPTRSPSAATAPAAG